ncbi:MAG: beta-galactosidase [Sediminibacterium magnilacihabitans]|jgi:beta-galactosidase/beta-glucuronidase|nr:beta-galactosidase [Sediminibacterium magnilacihabitans]PQV60354.1 glycosyl hydrolase family 2 [Sediminibacterium magnilacihabitans]
MKRSFFISVFFFAFLSLHAQNAWKRVPGTIATPWADSVDPKHVLDAYPRPQLQREQWTNLNGLWDYAILPKTAGQNIPATYQGKLLVPFAVESSLSGAGKTVGKDSILWYHTVLQLTNPKNKQRTLLHFGAVDWQATIYVNGKEIGSHEGGYDPFTVDISSALIKGSKQELAVRVWDPSDDGPQPRGKQVKKPAGIWYTPVTGIWQTVWLETVPETYITALRSTPDLDKATVTINAAIETLQPGDQLLVSAWNNKEKIAEYTGSETNITLHIPDPKTWSPDHPFLYDLQVSILRKSKLIDQVKGYFAMRKISIAPDSHGIQKMMLNNKFCFQYGPLDQGWWPDGLYTAPTDAALKYDLLQTKAMGFNMIRKHVKVEPARWYYYCDQLGILVWQDMPSGDLGNHWENRPGVLGRATDKDRTPESIAIYHREWNHIMDALYPFPCIVVWVPFNEAWGQFNTVEIAKETMQKDPSRLVNSASGGNFYTVGHIIDLHNYPDPAMPRPDVFGSRQALVLGEFGGLGLPMEGHTWQSSKNWGYQSFKNREELFQRYLTLTDKLQELIKAGLSAAVYTQTTDVEIEVNGFMTYDRKVLKMPLQRLHEVNMALYKIHE